MFPLLTSKSVTFGDSGPNDLETCMVTLLRGVLTWRALENLHRNNKRNLRIVALLAAWDAGIKLSEDENRVLDV